MSPGRVSRYDQACEYCIILTLKEEHFHSFLTSRTFFHTVQLKNGINLCIH